MKVEIEFTILKRVEIECNTIDDAKEELKKLNWREIGRIVCREPQIVSKIVTDDEIANWNPRQEILKVKPEHSLNEIYNQEDWSIELKNRIRKIHEENGNWSNEKCRWIAIKDMPPVPCVK